VKLSYLEKPIPLPASFLYTIADKEKIRAYISARNECFFVSVKGRCAVNEETINFPPIIRNVTIKTDKETIGEYTYNYMKANNVKTDQEERKLTQLLNTHGEFQVFYSTYLYFLIDRCGFVIEDVERLHVFSSHTSFNEFATQTMERRQKAILEKDKVKDLFNKITLNGAFGYDIMNESNYRKRKVVNRHKCFLAHLTPNFRHSEKLGEDCYLVESIPKSFNCKTCLHEGITTLDIAKALYLNFLYNFLYKCIDMDRVHVVELDTDSLYLAVAGNGNSGFEDVIKDKEFYLANIGHYLTAGFYGVNKQFDSPLEKMRFEKRFGGLAIEKESKNMIALASKMYCIWDDTKETGKAKGVSQKFSHQCYLDVLETGKIINGVNRTLRMNNGEMSHISVNKHALTAIYNKMKVSSDGSFCCPLFLNVEGL
jgi:hypothetical protein